MKYILTVMCAILLSACTKKEEVVIDEKEEAKKDSLALHVAIFPCEGCLPIYYAEAKGLIDNDEVRLMHLSTMEDCDTALSHHRAEVTSTDVARLLCMRKDGVRATAIAEMPASTPLLSAKGKRINTVKQLKERLVAMDRHSLTDYLSDQMLQGTGLERLDIFRTQFNNHRIRMDMLNNALVDAAFLDMPYAALAQEKGAQQIWQNDTTQQGWKVLAVATSTLSDDRRMKQIAQLTDIYQKAVDELQSHADTAVIRHIYKEYYELPHEEVDTLPQLVPTRYHKLAPLKEETMERAKNWLIERKWISKSLKTDSIIHTIATF